MSKFLFWVFILRLQQIWSQTTSDCDIKYNCFRYPDKCIDNSCKYIYKWTDNGNSNSFIISAKIQNFSNRWMAIGFSNDRSMGDDNVIVCKTTGQVENYYNPDSRPTWLDSTKKSIGITNASVNQNDEWFICSFTRDKSNNLVKNYFDLNKKYYVLAAYGDIEAKPVAGESDLVQHDNSIASSQSYSYVGLSKNGPLVKALPVGFSLNTTDCGTKMGCFLVPQNCKDSDCTYIYKYSRDGDYIDFQLSANIVNLGNMWLAIGFSKDDKMSDDGVVLCKNEGLIEQRYNKEYAMPNLLDGGNPSFGLKNIKVVTDNNWLMCSFSRLIKTDDVANYFDLSINYYILAAYGKYDNPDTINQHIDKISDVVLTNFSSFQISGLNYDFVKYKTHGCLMVIAWILFASTGILFARYYKFLLPDREICGLQFWFVMHRPIMLSVGVISITSFLVILAQLDWRWVSIDKPLEFTHSVFGMTAIGISVLQPTIAYMRCNKDSKSRYLFNYVHRGLGILAIVCSIVAMFLGSVIDVMFLNNNGWGVLIGWTIWVIIIPVALEMVDARYGDEETKSSYTVSDDKKNLTRAHRIKEILLIVHVVVALAFTIALLVLIGIASTDHRAKDE